MTGRSPSCRRSGINRVRTGHRVLRHGPGLRTGRGLACADERWPPEGWIVVVRPPGAETGILARPRRRELQAAAVGNEALGRVGFFLRVDDLDGAGRLLTAAGVEFVIHPARGALPAGGGGSFPPPATGGRGGGRLTIPVRSRTQAGRGAP